LKSVFYVIKIAECICGEICPSAALKLK